MAESTDAPGAGTHDDPTALTTFLIGAISLVLLAVILLALEALHNRTVDAEWQRKTVQQGSASLRQARAEQLERLNSVRWVDRERGLASIPIERAMAIVVDEAKQR